MDHQKILFLYEVDEKSIRSLYKLEPIGINYKISLAQMLNLFKTGTIILHENLHNICRLFFEKLSHSNLPNF